MSRLISPVAGKGKGMSDTSTRSGMLWEVERILKECKELGQLPSCLVMENVPQVHSIDNMSDFSKWINSLEGMGYRSYWKDLIATDYGIPQTRNRTFMVSILGDYNYTFPKPIPLKLKLKDMLEDNVPEKYYLSDKMINCFLSESKDSKFPRKERFLQTFNVTNEKGIAATITTGAGNRATDNFIVGNIEKWHQRGNVYSNEHSAPTICATDYKTPKLVLTKNTENYIEWEDGKNIQMNCRAWKDDKVIATLNTGGETKILENKSLQKTLEQNNVDDICYIDAYNKKIDKNKSGTITTRVNASNNVFLAVKNNNKKGYLEAYEGDGVDISSRMQHHRGTVQKDKIQTIDTMGGESKGVVVLGNYSPSNHEASRIVDSNYSAPTIKENHGTINATQTTDLRIRKLTPKECFRLMGVSDEDFERCAKNQSDSSLYHLAGDSIIVDVLCYLFKMML